MPETYRQQGYRYVVLFVYVLAALVNSLPIHAFSSINSIVEDVFKLSPTVITLNTLFFPIAHAFAAFPANWILDKFGMKIGCSLGAFLVIIGVWMRTFLEVEKPYLCLVGSALAAIGNIFILNSASKVALNWFNSAIFPVIVSGSVLANLLSMTGGAAIPGFLINQDSGKSAILTFLRVEAIVITVPMVVLIILFKDKPKQPPSKASALQRKNKSTESYLSILKRLFKKVEYIKIMIAMSFSYGAQIALLATMDQLLDTLHYEKPGRITSIAIAFALSFGIFSSFGVSILVKKTYAYKYITIICSIGAAIALGLLLVIFSQGSTQIWLIGPAGGIMGLFMIPCVSLFLGYGSQAVFPIGQGSSAGYLFAAAQTFGFLLGILVIGILDWTDKKSKIAVYGAFGAYIVCILLSALSILTTKQFLEKRNYEQKVKTQSSDDLDNSFIVPEN